MATLDQSAAGSDEHDATAAGGTRRRDFLNVAAVSFAGVGTVAALAPLLVQMAPSKDVLAMATIDVDISKVQPGQRILLMSGTVDERIYRNAGEKPDRFLPKPYLPQDLAAAVKALV